MISPDFRAAERRGRTRYRIRIPFTLKGNGDPVQGTTRNISLLGISAYSKGPVDQVRPVDCCLEIPASSGRQVIARGTVTRCHPMAHPNPDGSFEIGVFFREFRLEDEKTLTHYLESVSSKEQAEIATAYKELKKKLADRKRRKQAELRKKRLKRLARLRKKQWREADVRKKKLARAAKKAAARKPSAASKKPAASKARPAPKKR